jgi:hypothetical protein
MFFMLDLCPNKVGKGEDHCYLYVAYCCSWEQVGEHHENHLKPKGFPLFISFFIFKLYIKHNGSWKNQPTLFYTNIK